MDITTTADAATAKPEPTAMEESDLQEAQEPRTSEKIDLSLDDIIKLNKKENKANKAANKARDRRTTNKNTVLKKLDRAGQQQIFPFRRGPYQFQQGPYKSRYMGPPIPGYYRVKPYLRKTPFGAHHLKGVSPLKRPSLNTKEGAQFGKRKPLFKGAFYQPYRGPPGALRRPPPQFRGQKKPPFQPKQRQGGGKPFILNRGFPAANGKMDKYQKVRSWKKAPSGVSTLTVSLPNSKANSEPAAKAKQATVMDRSSPSGASPQPKGIPLRFNFKATINQTGVTLNDRFTGMRIWAGPGQGPQRGSGRGRGRGREGRTVILQ
ncbi:UAP56-interacting factor-like [Salvelinus fontinalis]|uniref:UAP56-interacting factor-like n=1 Tax=Salvelinus fontinalis TaxID=8038 RepID=UPI0024859AFA|nr:UAP56-interacting factor-like [Salvelinus fontinalis]